MRPLGRQISTVGHHFVAPVCQNILLDFSLVSVRPFVKALGAALFREYTSKQPFFTVRGPHRGKQSLGRRVLS